MVVAVSPRALDVIVMDPPVRYPPEADLEAPERSVEHEVRVPGMVVVIPPVVIVVCGVHLVPRAVVCVRIESERRAGVAAAAEVSRVPDEAADEERGGGRRVHVRRRDQPSVDVVDREERVLRHRLGFEVVGVEPNAEAERFGAARGDGLDVLDAAGAVDGVKDGSAALVGFASGTALDDGAALVDEDNWDDVAAWAEFGDGDTRSGETGEELPQPTRLTAKNAHTLALSNTDRTIETDRRFIFSPP